MFVLERKNMHFVWSYAHGGMMTKVLGKILMLGSGGVQVNVFSLVLLITTVATDAL